MLVFRFISLLSNTDNLFFFAFETRTFSAIASLRVTESHFAQMLTILWCDVDGRRFCSTLGDKQHSRRVNAEGKAGGRASCHWGPKLSPQKIEEIYVSVIHFRAHLHDIRTTRVSRFGGGSILGDSPYHCDPSKTIGGTFPRALDFGAFADANKNVKARL